MIVKSRNKSYVLNDNIEVKDVPKIVILFFRKSY